MSFKPGCLFTDNMVLQRNKPIRVFGTGTENELVSATLKDRTFTVQIHEGRFEIIFPPLGVERGITLRIFSETCSFEYSNIAIGEVWLAGGQSNMEFELQNCTDIKPAASDFTDDIRFFYTPKRSYKGEEYEQAFDMSRWETADISGDELSKYDGSCVPDKMKAWSAVGWFFASRLYKEYQCPIGIIGCNWGGTSASCWVELDSLKEDALLAPYYDEYVNGLPDKSLEEQIQDYIDYQNYQADWDKKSAGVYAVEPLISWEDIQKKIGPCAYPGPVNEASFCRPGGLYSTMVSRLFPYSMRGFIFYQGENDAFRADAYSRLLTLLVETFRDKWKDPKLYFMNVQLPMHKYFADPVEDKWCVIREAQRKVANSLANAGLAVINDYSTFSDIHPKRKKIVGERLAETYLGLIAFPEYSYHTVNNNLLQIYFKNSEGGLIFKDIFENIDNSELITEEYKSTLPVFEIAGVDGIFYKSEFEISGDSIILHSEKVQTPVSARYLWSDFAIPCIFNGKGLPIGSFRTR